MGKREYKTIEAMIGLSCRERHGTNYWTDGKPYPAHLRVEP
jgi:hypothetical protein